MKCGLICLSYATQLLVLGMMQPNNQHFMNQAQFYSTFPILVITKIFDQNKDKLLLILKVETTFTDNDVAGYL